MGAVFLFFIFLFYVKNTSLTSNLRKSWYCIQWLTRYELCCRMDELKVSHPLCVYR